MASNNIKTLVLAILLFVGATALVVRAANISSNGNITATNNTHTNNTPANNQTNLKLSASSPKQATNASYPTQADAQQQQQQQLLLGGKCAAKSSCKQRSRQLDVDKRSCYCDNKCSNYDDCCHDSTWTTSFKQRVELGSDGLRKTRDQWHCHRVNPIFGDVLLKASCHADWLASNKRISERHYQLARLVERRCEYVSERAKGKGADSVQSVAAEQQLDPIGMMMPITDLSSGVTYANSHCLRCNKLINDTSSNYDNGEKPQKLEPAAPKLVYWSPLLECNYNLENDDRNTLYDLISARKGRVLQYSSKRNKWVIVLDQSGQPTPANGSQTAAQSSERVCSVTPTIPDSVEHMIRYCRSKSIDTCEPSQLAPGQLSGSELLELERARFECRFGHQALVYSQTSEAVYYNLGCAKCNFERQVFCEPKMRKASSSFAADKHVIHQINQQNNTDKILHSPTLRIEPSEPAEPEQALNREAGRSGSPAEGHRGTVISGSFSVLLDLYGSSQGDEQVGAVHQCRDPQRQVYDPFYLACRDTVCGLNSQLVDGKCTGQDHEDQQVEELSSDDCNARYRSNKSTETARLSQQPELVDKFKPAMVYLTTIGLVISIASLSTYLLLYCLSMFDLRHLLVDMAQHSAQVEQQQQQQQLTKSQQQQWNSANQQMFNKPSPLDKFHRIRGSNETNISTGGSTAAARSHSLSSRGVACLASSLLAAYLLFIWGHRPSSSPQVSADNVEDNRVGSGALSCVLIAVATYYCFLVAFNWMFLLSYDIWRTLRLATCQLRGPAMHSQSKRFATYTLFALIASALIVGTAVLFDQIPLDCGQQDALASHLCRSDVNQCAQNSQLAKFVYAYKPKFGQRTGSCWFSNRRSLALFFGLPVTLIMLANLLFFLHSSFMVIRTSSRSSRHLSHSGGSSPNSSINKLVPHQLVPAPAPSKQVGRGDSSASSSSTGSQSSCLTSSTSNGSSLSGYSQQNAAHSLTSVQTLQSHLSEAEQELSGADRTLDGAPRADFDDEPELAADINQQLASCNKLDKLRKLEPSQSSSSLMTNQSVGGASISASLAMKCDSLNSLMSRIVKDYRLYCRLSTIMGLTWLTGLMASLVDQSDMLWYLFVVLNTLQGLFIFIAFGCKRSKLANLEILLNYLSFRLRTSRFRRASSTSEASDAEQLAESKKANK